MTHSELESLVRDFESCTLPREAWTHRAHLAVTVWYLNHFSREEATRLIRTGIQRYNASLGNTKGYHETVTLAWIAIIAAELRQSAGMSVEYLASEVMSRYERSDFLRLHFSKELLNSELARQKWVNPDLSPLPKDPPQPHYPQ